MHFLVWRLDEMIEFLFDRIGFKRLIGRKYVLTRSAVIFLSLFFCTALFRCDKKGEIATQVEEAGMTGTASASGAPGTVTAQHGEPEAGSKEVSMPAETDRETGKIVQEGIGVEFSMTPVTLTEEASKGLMEGDDVTVQFRITDTTTGTPVTTLEPAAWIQHATVDDCKKKVQSLLTGGLASRAEIDLNVFYVLSLNDNASISVVDPLFNYGGSSLLAMILLKSPGEDWVMSQDQRRLYVTMPQANQVAVIDTATWKVITNIDTGQRPIRIALQKDGKYLWVGSDGVNAQDPSSGVTVIDLAGQKKVAHIPTGAGHHEIALTEDDRYAFVTNQDSGTVSVIDVWKLNKIKDIKSGKQPAAIAYSTLSKAVYVVNEADGIIIVIDGLSHKVVTRIEAEPGLKTLRFAPGGRLGFAVNSRKNVVHIIDGSTHRIIQTGDAGEEPDQIVFTDTIAYIRSRGSEMVRMIPLDKVGEEGAHIPVTDFSGGQTPFGKAKNLSVADGIVPAPGGGAVLVANPVEKIIYYYQEGMAAPMGSFKNYGQQPRAVQVVDRSLKEVGPGVYATTIKLRISGETDVVFFLDSPRIIHCFSVNVEDNPAISKKDEGVPLKVMSLIEKKTLRVGENVQLQFKVTDPNTDQPRVGLKDFGVMLFTTGNWQNRQWARSVGDGIYEIDFNPPKPGVYYISFQCPSLDVRLNQLPPLILQVDNKG